jgi:alpha-beta hydrolase superfamily lysophospholipase
MELTACEPLAQLRAAKAHKRAMPIARLVGNGMDYADAVELHALVDAGTPWADAAERLGDLNLARAHQSLSRGHRLSARSWFLHASACLRFGQVPLADTDPRKRSIYARMLDAFHQGGLLAEPAFERVEVPWKLGRVSGWIIPAAVSSPHPFVLQLCGIGGSREEYETGSRYLVDRGMTAILVDAPGQGETRLFGGLHLDEQVITAISVFVEAVASDERCNGSVGIWGNSAGGWLATLMAATDPRIAACCVTGGTDRPAEILDRYPRFIGEVRQMTGHRDPDAARELLTNMAIDAEALRALRCPLLVVHGTPDHVFRVDGARRIHAGASSVDKTLTEFPDGDHCISNRSHEKHTLISDWFAGRLMDRGRSRPRRSATLGAA